MCQARLDSGMVSPGDGDKCGVVDFSNIVEAAQHQETHTVGHAGRIGTYYDGSEIPWPLEI